MKKIEAAVKRCPNNVKLSPAALTERASEDHMVHSFLVMVTAKQATVVITYIIMTTFEHITCIQLAIHQKLAKNFETHDTTRAPEKRESGMGVRVSKVEPVVVG